MPSGDLEDLEDPASPTGPASPEDAPAADLPIMPGFREMVLRRARGYAPLPVHLKHPVPPILAVGAHLKNTVALSVGTEAR